MGISNGKIGGIILAAGLSSRMGMFKPLLPFAQSSMIKTIAQNLQQIGAEVIVVTGYRADEVVMHFSGWENIRFIKNENFQSSDMLLSVKIGLREAEKFSAVYIIPVDMPAISVKTLKILKKSMNDKPADIVVPIIEGKRKHPPLLGANSFSFIEKYTGTGGLKKALEIYPGKLVEVAVPDFGCAMDADTWADYLQLTAYADQTEVT